MNGRFEKGNPKPPNSGRKKGSLPTPKTLRQGLADKGFDITKEFLDLYKVTTDPKDRLAILKTLAQYTQPPPKAAAPDDDPPPDNSDDEDEEAKVLQLLKDS